MDLLLTEAGFAVMVIDGGDCPDEILQVVGPADYDTNLLFCRVKQLGPVATRASPFLLRDRTGVLVIIDVSRLSDWLVPKSRRREGVSWEPSSGSFSRFRAPENRCNRARLLLPLPQRLSKKWNRRDPSPFPSDQTTANAPLV